MFKINVMSLARVYVPECGNVGPAQATGEGASRQSNNFSCVQRTLSFAKPFILFISHAMDNSSVRRLRK